MDEEQTTHPLTGTPAQTLQHKLSGPPKWRSCRFLLAYLILGGNAVIFFQRVSFSMAVVCMVNHTALHLMDVQHVTDVQASAPSSSPGSPSSPRNASEPGYNAGQTAIPSGAYNGSVAVRSTPSEGVGGSACDGKHVDNGSSKEEDGPMVWTKQTQGLLLGAVYWGYMTTQVFGGYLFYLFGPRLVTVVSMLVMALLTVLCHPAALWSPWAVFVLRVAMGVATSFAIPSMLAIWGSWAPSEERATLIGLSSSGQNLANSAVFPTAALLCKYGFAGGWPSVFYVYGLLGVVWCGVWVVLVSDSPETSRWISTEEKDYIQSTRTQVSESSKKLYVPWCRIFTSSCFWAIVAAHVSFTWGLFLFMSNLPLYMYEVMNFDIKANGFYSMLPYIALFLVQSTGGFLADCVVKRQIISAFWARRFFVAVANLVPACCLLAMSYLDCRQVAAVMSLLVVSVGCMGFAFSGFLVNFFEIAPRYAVSIISVSNSFACLPGIITPYLVAVLTPDQTRKQWQVIFFVTCGVNVLGTVLFCLFASTSVQQWAQSNVPQPDVAVNGGLDPLHLPLGHSEPPSGCPSPPHPDNSGLLQGEKPDHHNSHNDIRV